MRQTSLSHSPIVSHSNTVHSGLSKSSASSMDRRLLVALGVATTPMDSSLLLDKSIFPDGLILNVSKTICNDLNLGLVC